MSDRAPRFTRRTVLGGAAAAGAGVLLGPVAGAAAAPQPCAVGLQRPMRVFGRWVGGLDGGSSMIDAPARLGLAGVQWSRRHDDIRIELRPARVAAGGAGGRSRRSPDTTPTPTPARRTPSASRSGSGPRT